MRIVVDINHPAHVHYFKNFIWKMEKRGHELLITATDKDIALRLLDIYGFDYIKLGSYGKSLFRKAINLPIIDIKMYKAVKSFNPDIFLGAGSIRGSHVAAVLRKTSVNFEDTEHSMEQIRLYLPFVSAVLTPQAFRRDLGKKQIRFNGHMELAYLHPNYFKPDPSVLDELGLSRGDTFIVLRFVSWTASHDIGQKGIRNRVNFVKELEKYGMVLITSEGKLEKELEKYRVKIPPERMHDLLYYATLYVGEGGTTASEAAILGTHSIHISTTGKYCGVFYDLNMYGLLWISEEEHDSMELIRALLSENDLWKRGKKKRKKLIKSKIDLTSFMVWFIENYPNSLEEFKEKPQIQYKFSDE